MRTTGKEKKLVLSTNHFPTPSMQRENHLGPLTNGNGDSKNYRQNLIKQKKKKKLVLSTNLKEPEEAEK